MEIRSSILLHLTRSATLLLFSIGTLLAGSATIRGQSALDGFDPNANGPIRAIVVQPDGKILIGGSFTTVLGVQRNRIARLNADGTLDAAFDPNANGDVFSIVVQADGKILVGGNFSVNFGTPSIGGQGRNRIARLDAVTGLADSFNPNASSGFTVYAIAVQADGKILAGGDFFNVGGQSRSGIARLDAVTGLADSFNPNATGGGFGPTVFSIAVQADGKVLVGGDFTGIGGQSRTGIARLDASTGAADSFSPNANGYVLSIAVQTDSKILVGGAFTGIGGQSRNRIARLDAITGAADSFNPNANGGTNPIVRSITQQADGQILVGGDFANIGGQPRNYVGRLDASSGAADSFNPNASGSNFPGVSAIAVQADNKVLVGGSFTTLTPNGGASVTRNNIARLETDGRLDQTLNLSTIGNDVDAIAVQSDGKILIGGDFWSVLGVPRNYIARLNPDGTLDTAFDPNANNGVYAIAVQADGKILVGGAFVTIGGQMRNYIARLDATTGLADSFDPNADSYILSIAVQADGKILASGYFPTIGGQTRHSIARLDATTGLADSFNPNPNSTVESIAVQADGKILAGGYFSGASSIGGQTRNFIARLDATTGLADSFDPNANEVVYALAVQADGKILVGGNFNGANGIGGQTRNYIARLDATTGLADSFDPNANNTIKSIAVQADGKILVGGRFYGANGIGGQTRSLFARLSNNTAALQNLAVTQTSITWIGGGSSPQFTRVSFEYSTDNVNYTPLGNGTASGNNWTLTGLNLPAGQNLYIRARGYYRSSGFFASSECITESVRNTFLAAPLQLTTAVSRRTHGVGVFDINLPLTGAPGVECRDSGGNQTLVFTTSNNLVSGNASVTSGTGSVAGTPTFAANTMTVNLTGVTDVQKITVTLSGVTDSFAQVLPNTPVTMGVLIGDAAGTGNGSVGASDVGFVKSKSGQTTDATNFRADVAVNGSIGASDIGLTKSKSGNVLPP